MQCNQANPSRPIQTILLAQSLQTNPTPSGNPSNPIQSVWGGMFRTAAAAVGHDPRTAAGAVRTDSPYSTECWNKFLGGTFEMKSKVIRIVCTDSFGSIWEASGRHLGGIRDPRKLQITKTQKFLLLENQL